MRFVEFASFLVPASPRSLWRPPAPFCHGGSLSVGREFLGGGSYASVVKVLAPFLLLLIALIATTYLDPPLPRADLVIVERSDCFTLDPQRMSYQHEIRRGETIYEGLVALNPKDCSIKPGVAQRWSTSSDGLVWTFNLRRDAKWSNGDLVTTKDFVYAWRRALLPDTAADYSGFFFEIEGAEAFFQWRAKALAEFNARNSVAPTTAEDARALWETTESRFRDFVGIRALDEFTLEVRLRRPLPYFLDLCAFAPFSPVHRASVEQWTHLDARTGRMEQSHGWTKPPHLISNGPYVPTVWRYKRDMRLEKNAYYWDAARVPSQSVEVRVIENPNTQVLAFGAGGVDWLPDVGPEYKTEMLAQRRLFETRHAETIHADQARGMELDECIRTLPSPMFGERRDIRALNAYGTDFFSFNCRPTTPNGAPNPFHQVGVRRAFAMAADKQALIDRVTRLGERVATTLVPPGSIQGYPLVEGLPFDATRARAELANAGWVDRDNDGFVDDRDGKRFPTVDLLYSTASPRYQNLALALRDMWRRELGVPVEVRGKDAKLYKEDVKKGNFSIARGGWYGDYGDPSTFLELQRSTDGNNDRGYKNPAFDAMLDDAQRETDPDRRLERLAECERFLFAQEVPLLPICSYVTVYMYDPSRLHGIREHPRLEQHFDEFERIDAAEAEASP